MVERQKKRLRNRPTTAAVGFSSSYSDIEVAFFKFKQQEVKKSTCLALILQSYKRLTTEMVLLLYLNIG